MAKIRRILASLLALSMLSTTGYALDGINTGDVSTTSPTIEVEVPDKTNFKGLSAQEPAAWSAPQIYSAMKYSDAFILDWDNSYSDNLTRGQFGILIDATLYGKLQTYPEFELLANMAAQKVYGTTMDAIRAEVKKTKEEAKRAITGADWNYLGAVDKELNCKANAVEALATLYTTDKWLADYGAALNSARTQHFIDTDVMIRQYCEILYNLGITNGVSDTTFEPNRPITRQEAAVMISNLLSVLGFNTSTVENATKFNDDEYIDDWAKKAVYIVATLKIGDSSTAIMSGVGGNKFDPLSNITIEQAICVVYRLTTIL